MPGKRQLQPLEGDVIEPYPPLSTLRGDDIAIRNPDSLPTTTFTAGRILGLLVAIAIPVGGGILSGYLGMRFLGDKKKKNKDEENTEGEKVSKGAKVVRPKKELDWYDSLKKPSWNPPSWVFGPTWTVLYLLMGIASFLVWQNGGGALPLVFYSIQLLINFAWSPVFFGLHRPDIALGLIVTLWFLLVVTMILFYQVSTVAMLLLVPYLLWITYASTLNAYIVYNN